MRHILARAAVLTAVTAAALSATAANATTAAVDQLDVNRHGVVTRSTLPTCTEEDASSGPVPCSWNFLAADTAPPAGYNPRRVHAFHYTGTSEAPRIHYVWAANPAAAARWEWVRSPMADALAESDAPHASTRDWRRCVVRHADTTVVRCADGTRVTS